MQIQKNRISAETEEDDVDDDDVDVDDDDDVEGSVVLRVGFKELYVC